MQASRGANHAIMRFIALSRETGTPPNNGETLQVAMIGRHCILRSINIIIAFHSLFLSPPIHYSVLTTLTLTALYTAATAAVRIRASLLVWSEREADSSLVVAEGTPPSPLKYADRSGYSS